MKKSFKVFILDNVKAVRSRLQQLLNSEDLYIIEASNSSAFFDAFLQNKCNGNLIIMDIESIAEDGFEVIRKIRNKNKKIPILILTANTNCSILNKIISEGATDYFLKPFDDILIRDKVNKILYSYSNSQDINEKIYEFISTNKKELSEKILYRHLFYQPELKFEFIDVNYDKYLYEISSHLTYFSEAINLNNLLLYNDHITWKKILDKDSDIPAKNISITLNCMKDILVSELSEEMSTTITCFIDAAIKNLLCPITYSKTFIDKNNVYYNILVEYLGLILKMQRLKAGKLIMDEVEKGVSIKDIYIFMFLNHA